MNRFFLLIACIIFSVSTVANGFEVDGVYYWITNDTIQPFSVEVRQPKYGFYSAKKVEIPSSIVYSGNTYIVTSISGIAFLGASMTELTIPSSVTRIIGIVDGLYADNIVIHAITPPDTYCSSIYSMRNKTLYVPKESLRNYAEAEGWKDFPRIMPIGGSEKDCIYHPDYDPKNKVESVAGCRFGIDKDDAISFFKRKYNSYSDGDNYVWNFYDISFAGYMFDCMTLHFFNGSYFQWFHAIDFQKGFELYEYERAKRMFESIRKLYSSKYSNESKHEDYLYTYGAFENDYEDGEIKPIILELKKSYSKGGKEYYYITISYYIAKTFDVYSDDI